MVRCPLTASTAIFAFKSALYCLRCRFVRLRFEAAILHLSGLSEFWGVAQCAALRVYCPGPSPVVRLNAADTLSATRKPAKLPVVNGFGSGSPNVLLPGFGVTNALRGAITKLAVLYVIL